MSLLFRARFERNFGIGVARGLSDFPKVKEVVSGIRYHGYTLYVDPEVRELFPDEDFDPDGEDALFVMYVQHFRDGGKRLVIYPQDDESRFGDNWRAEEDF